MVIPSFRSSCSNGAVSPVKLITACWVNQPAARFLNVAVPFQVDLSLNSELQITPSLPSPPFFPPFVPSSLALASPPPFLVQTAQRCVSCPTPKRQNKPRLAGIVSLEGRLYRAAVLVAQGHGRSVERPRHGGRPQRLGWWPQTPPGRSREWNR